MGIGFKKAVREAAKLKLAITGPSGGGKTFSALRLATGMGGKIALIDTENNSASLYSDRFQFDVLDMAPPFTHEKFIEAIRAAEGGGYDVLVIDSASHFWEGILEYKSRLDSRGGNSYSNWNEAGQKFKGIVDAVLQSRLHVICCMRSKMDYAQEKDDRGKTTIRKVGLAPIMRDGIQYEFTTVWDVDMSHNAQASKDRTGLFGDGIEQITEAHGVKLLNWLKQAATPSQERIQPVEAPAMLLNAKVQPQGTPEAKNEAIPVSPAKIIASEDKINKMMDKLEAQGYGVTGEELAEIHAGVSEDRAKEIYKAARARGGK